MHARSIQLAAVCLLASGAASLIYEIAWIRQASLVFGSGTLAVSTVVGVFFAGLAAGSEAFGRLALRLARPLRTVAALEAVLLAWGLASPWMFDAAEALLAPLHRALAGSPVLLGACRLALVAAVVFPPAVLMGGTLPLFCRRFVRSDARIAAPVGVLYGVNTLGATAGCLAAGLVLLPRIGTSGALLVAAALNAVAAAAAAMVLRAPGTDPASPAPPAQARAPAAQPPARGVAMAAGETAARPPARDEPAAADGAAAARRRLVGALYFLVGFTALGHEVLWTRLLSLVVRHSAHTWSLTLGAVLGGIVLGSLLAALVADRTARRALLFGWLQIGAALVVLVTMLLPATTWRALGYGSVWLLLLPATLSGASYPVAVRLVVDDARRASLGVGRLAALNATGGIAGSLLVGFAGIPLVGLHGCLLALTALGLLTGAAAWIGLDRAGVHAPRLAALGLAVAAWALLPPALGTRLPDDHLVDDGETLLARVEGLAGNLAVLERDGVRSLEIDRWWQGEDRRNHQSVAACIPLLLHPDPRRVLVVGVGTGQTPARLLRHGVEQLDAVDVEPAVFDVIREHFDGGWLDDARVRCIADDGRHHVLHTRARYDLVALELGQLFVPGVAACYTTPFYERVRAALRPGGVVCQFVPAAFLTTETFARVVATFRAVFPACVLWYNTSELLLLGTAGESLALAPERLALLERDAALRAALGHSHWGGPEHVLARREVFLAGLLAGPDELAALSAGAAPLDDDVPALEEAAARTAPDAELEAPLVELLRSHLADVGEALGVTLAPGERAEVEAVRALNLGDMVASARLRRADALLASGDTGALLRLADEALAANPHSARARLLRGEALLALGRLEPARDDLAEAARQRPDDVAARRALGFALHRLGRPALAVPHYERALALRPDDAELHNNLGAALAETGRIAEAREQFAHAVRLRPTWREARTNLEQADAVLGAR